MPYKRKKRKAFITGVTGQDGSYLAEYLLKKDYEVRGMVRRSSSFNTGRIDHLIEKQQKQDFDFYRGDINDPNSVTSVLKQFEPDEIYHLAAQSHVKVGFEIPVYTFDTVATGTLNLFEAVRSLGLKSKIYFAGSSEMFGSSMPPQNENTLLRPTSPYAAAKIAGYHLARIYRDAYGMWIGCGILFNHESPRRGETFVTRKITRAVARIKLGIQDRLYLGNMNATRDWGYAPDYVEAMWIMLQQQEPEDYVIATGESHSVREFTQLAFAHGGINLTWDGSGLEEKGIDANTGKIIVEVRPDYFRPLETDNLLGDSKKAHKKIGWTAKTHFLDLVKIMVEADLKQERILLEGTLEHDEVWRNHI